MTRAQRAEIVRLLPSAIAFAEAECSPGDERDRLVAIGIIRAMPSQSVEQGAGKAVLQAYDFALEDIPADLILKAAKAAVRDTSRTFRPGPAVLRGYIEPEFDGRRLRLNRLRRMAADAQREAPPVESEADRAIVGEGLKKLAAELAAKCTPMVKLTDRRRTVGPLRMPTVETYVALGLTREAAILAVADMHATAADGRE